MMNIKALDNTKNSQTLLPVFAETTDITSDSFKSLMEDMKEKNNMIASSYSSNEADIKSYREKNTYSSYNEKNSVSPYSTSKASSFNDKNSTSIYSKKNNRYDEDRQAYETVEHKSYTNENNSIGRKNRKEENTIEGKNILEKKDVKNLGQNITNVQNVQNGQNNVKQLNSASQQEVTQKVEENKSDEISMKDLLLLLQTASKQSSTEELNIQDTKQVDTELMIDDLDISEELKQTLKNVLETLKNLPQEDLSNISDYLNNALSNLELLNIQDIDEASVLSKLSEALMNGSDNVSLESAFAVLQEKIASLKDIIINTKDIKDTDDIKNIADIEDMTSEDTELLAEDNKNIQEKLPVFENDKSMDNETLSKIINDIALLVDKAVSEKENTGSEKVILAKDLLSVIKTALKESETSNIKISENNTEETIEPVKEILNMESTAEVLDTDTLNMQSVKNTNILTDNTNVENISIFSSQKNVSPDLKADLQVNVEKNALKPEVQTEENIKENMQLGENLIENADETLQTINNKEIVKQNIPLKNETVLSNNAKTFQEELSKVEIIETIDEAVKAFDEENMQKAETADEILTGKDSTEKIAKDTAKQSDVLIMKDVKKEFKTASVEVTESLRGQAQEKADAKSNTVNLSDTSKGLSNNNAQKDFTIMQNKAGENFSANAQDKGNNFNYFLKSSSEAASKYETAQTKETQAPYNMKDVRDIERLVRTMQSSVNKGQSKLTVVLTPENLGKLQIQLTETGGKITAKFLSDNEQSHKLIMAQSDMFKNQLSEKGIVIDNMEFAFNDTMSKGQNSDEQGRKTSKQAQKGRNFREHVDDLEVGTEVASKKASGIYA